MLLGVGTVPISHCCPDQLKAFPETENSALPEPALWKPDWLVVCVEGVVRGWDSPGAQQQKGEGLSAEYL